MALKDEDIARRVSERPGYSVVQYREVGLPVFKLQALLTLQSEIALAPTEEFILKCVQEGIDTSNEISDYLGIPIELVLKRVGKLQYEGALGFTDERRFVVSTPGSLRLSEAKSTSIVKEQFPIYVDGLTRMVGPITNQDLYTGRDLSELGIATIPPIPRRVPQTPDVDLTQVNRAIEALAAGRKRTITKRAIKLDALVGRTKVFFRRALALALKSDSGRSVVITFAIDGRISEEHEASFALAAPRSQMFGKIFKVDQRRRDVQMVVRQLREELPYLDLKADSPRNTIRQVLSLKTTPATKTGKKASLVRTLSVFDHPPLLRRAIEEAKSRLLVISPWIRAAVVDDQFLFVLEKCLRRNVQTIFAYGLGRNDRGEKDADKAAVSTLRQLESKYSNFRLVRMGDTHAKVLLMDEQFFVTTSFNWLSFKGDPGQSFREEEGTYVEGRDVVEDYYLKLTSRLVDT